MKIHLFFLILWEKLRIYTETWKYPLRKGLIYLALADPQEFFQQHLMKNEEQPSFGKRYSMYFGEESAMLLFA